MKKIAWKRPVWTLFATAVLVVSLAGCSSTPAANQPKESQPATEHAAGDLRETTKNVNQLPSFINGLDPMVSQVYQVAAQNASLLEWIPCYCGCGQSAGHKSNRDCFIQEIKKDGTVVWDSHGTKCGTCLEIAAESAALKKQGKSTLEIRKYIDNKYKEGFAKPTPTPMPS